MKNPLVSLVVPVYQVESYLDTCVQSLVDQTYGNIEIILVDDGSKDQSGEMCEAWAVRDKRIRVIHQENQGLSGARNTGMADAKGEYLVFVDSDDWMALDIIEKAVQVALQDPNQPIDLVLWRYKKVTEQSESEGANFLANPQWTAGFEGVSGIKTLELNHLKGWEFRGDVIQNELFRKVLGPMGHELKTPMLLDSNTMSWAKLYRLDLLKAHRLQFLPTQQIGSEDLPFTLSVLRHAKSAVWLNEFGLYYRKDNSSSLTKNHGNTLFKRYVSLNQYLDKFYENQVQIQDLEGIYRRALNNRQALNILNVCLSLMYRGYQASHWEKYQQLNEIFGDTDYRQRLKKLEINELSLGFRAFYFAAKYRITLLGFVLLKLMLWVNRRKN